MNKRFTLVFLISWFVILALSFFSMKHISIDTDLLGSFNQEESQFSDAELKYLNKVKKQVFILVRGKNLDESTDVALRVINEFSDNLLIRNLSIKGVGQYKKLHRYYLDYKDKILSKDYKTKILANDFQSITDSALRKLYSPFSIGLSTFEEDPLFIVENFLIAHQLPFSLEADGQYLMTGNDTRYRLLEGVIVDEKESIQKLNKLQSTFKELNFLYFSPVFYEYLAKDKAFFESNLLGTISFVFLLLIFYFFKKGLKDILAILTSLCLTLALSFLFYGLIWGRMSIITPLLSISILGVLVDYFIHFLNHASTKNFLGRAEMFLELKRPLFWSGLTSILGYLFFFFSPLVILKEFSLLALISLPIAILVMYLYLPLFISHDIEKNQKGYLFVNEIFWKKYFSTKTAAWSVLAAGILFLYIVVFSTIKNDIRSFAAPEVHLLEQEKRMMALLEVKNPPKLIIVKGDSIQDLLENEEEFIKHNSQASFLSLSSWVPSKKTQRISSELYPKLSESINLLTQNIKRPFSTLKPKNQKNEMFIEIDKWASDFEGLPQAKLWLGLIRTKYYSIIQWFDDGTLSLNLDANMRLLDRVNDINSNLDRYAKYVLYAILVIVLNIFFFFALKFSINDSFWIIVPSALSLSFLFGILQLFRLEITLFHCLGGILILMLGLDYSFFYFFRKDVVKSSLKNSTTSKSVMMSSLTTMCSFGVLLLSSTSAVRSFGGFVFLGVFFCWFLCPLSGPNFRNKVTD